MNYNLNKPALVIENNLDQRWKDATIYNHYDNPLAFMYDVMDQKSPFNYPDFNRT